METYQLFIDGKFVDSETGETRPTFNPATEEPIAQGARASRGDARRAIEAARKSFDSRVWSGMDVRERARLLMRVVEKLKERQDELAGIESRDSGATIRKTSMMDIPIGIEHFKALVELGERMPTYEPLPWIDMPAISWNFVQREPIGVCAGIIPWNLPFMMAVWKIAPALVTGNSLVLKPASDTPLTALEIARAAAECGLPDGVLNVVPGPGDTVGEELCTHPMVDKVSLTGSTATGRHVMKLAADTVKKVTLELGGKSANIILDDADMELAVEGACFGTFFHQGQICESGTRVLVPSKIYDQFLEKMKKRAEALRIGYQLDPTSHMGPLVSKQQLATVERYVKIGKEEGAKLAAEAPEPEE